MIKSTMSTDELWNRILEEAHKYDNMADFVDMGVNSNSYIGTILRNIGINTKPSGIAWGWDIQLWVNKSISGRH